MEGDESDEESDEDEATTRRIFSVLDPTDTTSRARFTNLSNLGALRLLCDVDVRRAPERPLDVALAPSHRLISQNGWQEVYAGKDIWIYDGKSNQDQAVRVVGARGDMYGTATYVIYHFLRFNIGERLHYMLTSRFFFCSEVVIAGVQEPALSPNYRSILRWVPCGLTLEVLIGGTTPKENVIYEKQPLHHHSQSFL
jgi:hypothetical protein